MGLPLPLARSFLLFFGQCLLLNVFRTREQQTRTIERAFFLLPLPFRRSHNYDA